MSILDTVKKLLGAKPIDIGELNRRATRESLQEVPSLNSSVRPRSNMFYKKKKRVRSQQSTIICQKLRPDPEV